MLTEKELTLILGKDLAEAPRKQETFREWLMTKGGVPPKYVRYFTGYVDHLLRDNDTPFPTREDADRIAIKVLSSEYSKSYQKHLLLALECYMEYLGTPVQYKKPRQTKRSPKYLTQDQMKKLVRGARDYRSLALLIMFSTTGIRLNELRMLDIGDVDLERRVLTVRHAKRDKDREIPLSEDCVKVLKVYSDKCHKKISIFFGFARCTGIGERGRVKGKLLPLFS